MRGIAPVAMAAMLIAAPACAEPAIVTRGLVVDAAATAAGRALIARADAALDRPPGAIPRLHTEGTLPGHGIRDISLAAKRDHPIMLALALAWRMMGDRRYLAQATRYLVAWVDIYEPSFNPIDETGFDALVLTDDLIEAEMSPADRRMIAAFWRRMATGYLDSLEGRYRAASNNWQSHRVKLATLAAYHTGDARLIARARAAFARQIAANLLPDGSVRDFAERDALHYVTYDLDPLMMAALAAAMHGEDWFHRAAATGASLPRSLDWLADYADGRKVHVEFVRSKVQFDRDRAAAGDGEYGPHRWKPASAVDTFALAAVLDPRFRPLRDRLIAAAGRRPMAWLDVVATMPAGTGRR